MTTAAELSFDLGDTATYSARSCRWVPTGPGEWWLVIRQRKAKRETGKVETDVYTVHEQPDDGWGVREFLFANNTDTDESPVYGVETVFGEPFNCKECRGWQTHGHCKHADAIRVLLQQPQGE